MKPPKSLFVCQSCGSQSQKWLGRCDDCGAWNSFVEEKVAAGGRDRRGAAPALGGGTSREIQRRRYRRRRAAVVGRERVRSGARRRHRSGIARPPRRRARDRQVDAAAPGGGAFRRARRAGPVLLGGRVRAPDQVARASGSASKDGPLYLLAETCIERLIEEVERLKPALLIVDSIQTVFSLKMPSAPGQRRPGAAGGDRPAVHGEGPESADDSRRPRDEGRQSRRPEGARARRRHGAVLRGRAASRAPHRARRQEPVRRGQRARRVRDDGTRASSRCANPSQLFLAERPKNVPGSSVLCTIEGSRPILVEVQALVSASTYGNARRTASGLDHNRLSLLLAVLDKRAGLNLATDDVFVNVAGGMSIEEPAADLAVVAAVASSLRNRADSCRRRRLRRGRARRRGAGDDAGGAARRARRRTSGSRGACFPDGSLARATRRRTWSHRRPHGRRGARRADVGDDPPERRTTPRTPSYQ